jgi:hypothetical protein
MEIEDTQQGPEAIKEAEAKAATVEYSSKDLFAMDFPPDTSPCLVRLIVASRLGEKMEDDFVIIYSPQTGVCVAGNNDDGKLGILFRQRKTAAQSRQARVGEIRRRDSVVRIDVTKFDLAIALISEAVFSDLARLIGNPGFREIS